ncbi:MAG: hypothetical protein Q9209_007053 [Squamulea sp. 1 TL-2023]
MPRYDTSSNITSGMANMKVDSSKGGKLMGMFDRHATTKTSSSIPQPPADDDGYTKVQRRKTSTIDQNTLQVSSGNRQRAISFADDTKHPRRSPPSAAAQSRRSAYSPPKAHYKHEIPADTKFGGKLLLKEQYYPGMIIRALVHEQDFEASSSKSNITVSQDKYRTASDYGTIYTKCRKMIVLAKYEDHYTAIPVFTHNGNGLQHKVKPDEYVSIKDNRTNDECPAQSKHGHLETENMCNGTEIFHVKSTAHITYALARRYDIPVIKEGQLTGRSLNRLIELFNAYAPRPISRR